jgi:phage gpG-like protein
MQFSENKNGCSLTGDFSKLEELIKKLKTKGYVDVGVLGNESSPDGEYSVADYGAVHEFGSLDYDNYITQRSFIKMPIETKQNDVLKDVKLNFEKNLAEGNVKQILIDIGLGCEGVIQDAFDTGGFGIWRPIADETAKRKKGSTAILIDDGTLRKSITSKVGGI